MQEQILQDRVAIVTGAARGLGKGIAKAMAREGANVILCSRSLSLLQEHEKEIRGAGQKAVAFQVDVSDAEQVNRTVQEVLKRFGKVDILVNNAAVSPKSTLLETTDEVRDNTIAINFLGVWHCIKAVLPGMIKQRYGKIINISSVTGPMVSSPGMTIYSATKGAVSGLTRSLALEIAEYGINVNAICPGSFDTPMLRKLGKDKGWDSPDEYIKSAGEGIPMRRTGTIDEMGELAVFLASDNSKYITGTEIVIDGGNIIQEH